METTLCEPLVNGRMPVFDSAEHDDRRGLTVAARVNENEYGRIDAAARLLRRTRSDYLREVALRAAEADLRAAADGNRARGART